MIAAVAREAEKRARDQMSAKESGSEKSPREIDEEDEAVSPPPYKRERNDSLEGGVRSNGSPLAGANIRIANRGKN